MDWLDELESLVSEIDSAGVEIEFRRGPSDRDKRAARVTVSARGRGGSVRLWDTGECDIEELRGSSDSVSTTQLSSRDELRTALFELVARVKADEP
jgi:hypothetical protein